MTQETPQALFRLRVGYKKSGRLAYLGHLEVIGTIERIIRRAALPYAVTQGFSPHMRIGYTSALPVGTSSTCEWYDVFLTELVDSEDALNRLRASSPADLEPFVAGYIDVRSPALTAQITRVRYKIVLRIAREIACDANAIEAALARIHSTPELPYLRGKKNKVLDLAKTLLSYSVERQSDDLVSVELDTYCDNDGSLVRSSSSPLSTSWPGASVLGRSPFNPRASSRLPASLPIVFAALRNVWKMRTANSAIRLGAR